MLLQTDSTNLNDANIRRQTRLGSNRGSNTGLLILPKNSIFIVKRTTGIALIIKWAEWVFNFYCQSANIQFDFSNKWIHLRLKSKAYDYFLSISCVRISVVFHFWKHAQHFKEEVGSSQSCVSCLKEKGKRKRFWVFLNIQMKTVI